MPREPRVRVIVPPVRRWYNTVTTDFHRSLYFAFCDIRVVQYFANFYYLTLKPEEFSSEDVAVLAMSYKYLNSDVQVFAEYMTTVLQTVRDKINNDNSFKRWMHLFCHNVPIDPYRNDLCIKLARYTPNTRWPAKRLKVHK